MFVEAETPSFLRFDAVRFEALIALMTFDESGQVSVFPDSHTLMAQLTAICRPSI